MANEEQQQATNPGIVEGLGNAITSPFTKGADGYNLTGALLFGAGTGLTTWLLSRMFGMKGGPSLAASILAGLGGAHVALTKQGGGDYLNPNYWRDIMDRKRVDNGPDINPDDEDAAIRRQLEEEQRQAASNPQGAKNGVGNAVMDKLSNVMGYNKSFDTADPKKGTMSLAPTQDTNPSNRIIANAEKFYDNNPANLSPEELEKGETRPLTGNVGKREYMNMIRNGMVTPEAHARAIENGIKANPNEPYIPKLIDLYKNRKDIDNTAAQARRVDIWSNKLQNAINNFHGKADERMRAEQEAMLDPQRNVTLINQTRDNGESSSTLRVPSQGYSHEDVNALNGNYPTVSPKEVAMNQALRNAREMQARRQALHEQDMADVAKRVEAIKREQAMNASMNAARRQMAMDEAMRKATARQDAMNESLRKAGQGLAMDASMNAARKQMAMDEAMKRSRGMLPTLPKLPRLPKIPTVNDDIRTAIDNQPGYVNPFSPYK